MKKAVYKPPERFYVVAWEMDIPQNKYVAGRPSAVTVLDYIVTNDELEASFKKSMIYRSRSAALIFSAVVVHGEWHSIQTYVGKSAADRIIEHVKELI